VQERSLSKLKRKTKKERKGNEKLSRLLVPFLRYGMKLNGAELVRSDPPPTVEKTPLATLLNPPDTADKSAVA
jgi:hypothetical protein